MATLKLGTLRPGEAFALEIWDDDKPLAHIVLEAPELTDAIRMLGDARASLHDEVAHEIDPGTRSLAIADPRWSTPKLHPEGYRALSLRHPGFGWLSFAFPMHEATAIAALLTDPEAQTHPLDAVPNRNPFLRHLVVEVSRHAATVISERGIEDDWINRAMFAPDSREPDPNDPDLIRHFKAIPERDGRVLRLVVRPLPSGYKIITVFFDRSRPR